MTTASDPIAIPALTKATAETAGAVLGRCAPSERAAPHLGDAGEAPSALMQRLVEAGLTADAITLLAHLLPAREGTWWAAQAARTLELGGDGELPRRCVRAAETWVAHPDDERRRAAMDLAAELGTDHAAAWAATAAFWAGDSLAPADQPPVPPPDHLWCHAVNGAVLLTAAHDPHPAIAARQRGLLGQGIDIATGGTGRPRHHANTG